MTMCYHPWVGLDVSPQGEFKPCCKYNSTIATNLDNYASSSELLQLQRDFLAGKKPLGCNRCWKDEEAGLPSKRILDNRYLFNNEPPNLNGIHVLGLTFGNTCNLACRICNSYPSSKWGAESKKLAQYFPDIPIWGHNQFYKDPGFVDSLLSKLELVSHIEIAGGEPFYADDTLHQQLLTALIDNKQSNNISLHYITNGTKLPSHEILHTLWPQFKKVDIQISIDGTEKQFEYNRWPAKWPTMLENLNYWVDYKTKSSNTQLSISHTVSIFTLHGLPEFLAWCKDHGLPVPYLGLLSRPDYYSITVLPLSAKAYVEQKFLNYNMVELVPIVQAMWAKDDSNQLDTTIKYVKILDKHRGQSFRDAFPETYQLLGETCHNLYLQY